MDSSSAYNTNLWKHEVFLSFRGKDTRTNFTSHLYHALSSRGINTFIDDKLERGAEISPALLDVIEGSRISLVVFSQDYASSTYCLDELVKILDCKESRGQIVLPIFYKVDPTDVEEQTGSFGEALAKHEAFMGNSYKLQTWRVALAKAANLSGWHLYNQDEANFIQSIIEKVLTKLDRTLLHVAEYPVGLASYIQGMHQKLCIASNDVRMVGIWGIGGIGKTTIAKAVYNRIAYQFQGTCFLASVREISKNHGLAQLQETLLFEIIGEKKFLMGNVDLGINVIRNRLCSKKVLIVIDDIDNVDQLKKLAGAVEWFGLGSRIIITTRDEHLLTVHGVERVHKVEQLCAVDALQLFSWHAFKKSCPIKDYEELSHCVMQYAKGLPLALVVLGSFLCGRSVHQWKSELEKLKRLPNKQIFDILKISFDRLEEDEKAIFLDIACFFKGKKKDYVMKILDACDLNPAIGIPVLIEKSLINIESDKLQMHDLLQSMGRQIVHQESPAMPGKRSRLWFHEDVLQVLRENTGTHEIEGIVLDWPEEEEVKLSAKAFTKMKGLRILIVRSARITGVPKGLPNELRWLEWPECPLKSLPSTFHARKLVAMNMHNSHIKQLGVGFKNYFCLKYLRFSDCAFIEELPDFSTIPNLERLILKGCENLVQIHPSIGFLEKLVILSLECCSNLKILPSRIKLKSLRALYLTGCTKLEEFPNFVEEMSRLEILCLSRTAIKTLLPSSIKFLTGLNVMSLSSCKNLTDLPCSIYKLKCLRHLDLHHCLQLCNFPVHYMATEEAKKEVPIRCYSSNLLFETTSLNLRSSLPRRLSLNFPTLKSLDLKYCSLSKVNFLSFSDNFSMLTDLDLSGNNFASIPSHICRFTNLLRLRLSKCNKLQEIPELPLSIKSVNARDCKSLEKYSQLTRIFKLNTEERLKYSRAFDFSNCHKLAEVQVKSFEGLLLRENDLSSYPGDISLIKGFCSDFQIEILLPGTTIPEWFSYCCEDNSLSFQVPSDMNGKITALVVCAILRYEGAATATMSGELSVNGRNIKLFSRDFFSLESDHMWLVSIPSCCITGFDSLLNNGLNHFEVSFKMLGATSDAVLKKCGAYVVYRKLSYQSPILLDEHNDTSLGTRHGRNDFSRRSWNAGEFEGYPEQEIKSKTEMEDNHAEVLGQDSCRLSGETDGEPETSCYFFLFALLVVFLLLISIL